MPQLKLKQGLCLHSELDFRLSFFLTRLKKLEHLGFYLVVVPGCLLSGVCVMRTGLVS